MKHRWWLLNTSLKGRRGGAAKGARTVARKTEVRRFTIGASLRRRLCFEEVAFANRDLKGNLLLSNHLQTSANSSSDQIRPQLAESKSGLYRRFAMVKTWIPQYSCTAVAVHVQLYCSRRQRAVLGYCIPNTSSADLVLGFLSLHVELELQR
jgi:hypothetical protein